MAKFNIDAVEAKTMHGLKDFQRATVERIDYLFRVGYGLISADVHQQVGEQQL